MQDGTSRQFEILLEGEQGHSGNVLATTFIVRVHKLLNLLHRLERLSTGAASRKTEFEITEAVKYNPTVLRLKPVPKVKNYDPIPDFDWSFHQFENVAKGTAVDPRLDVATLGEMHELAQPPRDGAFRRFWIAYQGHKVEIDSNFASNALAAAVNKQKDSAPRRWHTGVSFGQITGDLRAVIDESGEQEFIIHPRIGPDRIICHFTEDKRSLMNNFLFETVVVEGKLHYGEDSPHPKFVEMIDIKKKATAPSHLLELRGSFANEKMPEGWMQL